VCGNVLVSISWLGLQANKKTIVYSGKLLSMNLASQWFSIGNVKKERKGEKS
jgi:hypothetical protein